ncbi:hypothetical protein [Halolactibacillus sp. JCM 19043]|uniref:hypothetical protein n=1 Tax=Halolactibacillus sp. JCM 19043 TaxID=1460638 RepID=UPI0007833C3C|nr:hypothetical protein [Halolactibacillus sp. JCM 19043]
MTLSCPSLRDDQGSVTILALFVVIGLLLSLTSLTTVYLTEKQFTELERVQLNHHSLHQMTYQLVLNQVNQTEVPPAKFASSPFLQEQRVILYLKSIIKLYYTLTAKRQIRSVCVTIMRYQRQ